MEIELRRPNIELEIAEITQRALQAQIRYHVDKLNGLYAQVGINTTRINLLNGAGVAEK